MFQITQPFGQSPLNALPNDGFIRQKHLIGTGFVPFSSTTLWRKINEGKFPKPVAISDNITAWRVADVKAWAKDPAGYKAESQTEA